ncbi:hypothetical protein [Chitinimonas naiadis]
MMLLQILFTLLYLLLAAVAGGGFFLASVHQLRWPLSRPQARRVRWGASLCLLASVRLAAELLGAWSGCFAALSAFMLVAVTLPYVQAYWRRNHVG